MIRKLQMPSLGWLNSQNSGIRTPRTPQAIDISAIRRKFNDTSDAIKALNLLDQRCKEFALTRKSNPNTALNLQGQNLSPLSQIKAQYGNEFFPVNLEDLILQLLKNAGESSIKEPLKGANLEKANLSGLNLRNVTLDGANLSHTTFQQANLSKASLKDVQGKFPSFSVATLWGADFSGSDLTHANFVGATLSYTNLGVNFKNADLSYANFSRDADLTGCDFTVKNLNGASLPESLEGAYITSRGHAEGPNDYLRARRLGFYRTSLV